MAPRSGSLRPLGRGGVISIEFMIIVVTAMSLFGILALFSSGYLQTSSEGLFLIQLGNNMKKIEMSLSSFAAFGAEGDSMTITLSFPAIPQSMEDVSICVVGGENICYAIKYFAREGAERMFETMPSGKVYLSIDPYIHEFGEIPVRGTLRLTMEKKSALPEYSSEIVLRGGD